MAEGQPNEKHEKSYEIIVDGQARSVEHQTVTYDEITKIAYPDKAGNPDFTFVVIFRKAHDPKEGSLAEGGSVQVKQTGTIFNVTHSRLS
jgi:hypothetical protein